MKGETIVINTKIAEAMEVLIEALRTAPDYYDTWKSNLAMAYHDEWYTQQPGIANGQQIHKVFNDAADRFLKQLTYKSDEENQ